MAPTTYLADKEHPQCSHHPSLEAQNADSSIGELNDLVESVETQNDVQVAQKSFSSEAYEHRKSEGQLVELIENKELGKNASTKEYCDKTVPLPECSVSRESRVSDVLNELFESHKVWDDEKFMVTGNTLLELGKKVNDVKEDMCSKFSAFERKYSDNSTLLKLKHEKVKELESKLQLLQEELFSSKVAAACTEQHISAELSDSNKLVKLYKEYSEVWSEKAADLEGVIKAMEKDYEKEASLRIQSEKEASRLREEVNKCKEKLESCRYSDQLYLPQVRTLDPKVYGDRVDLEGMGRGDLMHLEEDWTRLRGEIITFQSKRDRLILESNFARRRLDRFMKDFELERDATSGSKVRNDDISRLIADYQKSLHKFSLILHSAEDLRGKLNKDSFFKCEKTIMSNAEKIASEEFCSLYADLSQLIVDYQRKVREFSQILQAAKDFARMQNIEVDEEEQLISRNALIFFLGMPLCICLSMVILLSWSWEPI